MANISLQGPLLFIDGPPIVMIVPFSKEESTSVYWTGHEPEAIPLSDSAPDHENKNENENEHTLTTESGQLESPIVRKLRYLAEPFPRTAYRPLQFLVDNQLLTGAIESLTDSEIAIEVTQESRDRNEVRTLGLHEIEEVFWKGSPFK